MAAQPIKLREKFGCWLSQPCPIPVDRIHVNMIFKSLLQPPWKEPEGDLQVCLGKLYLRRRRVQPSTIWWCGPLGRTLQSASILRANYGDGEGTKYKQTQPNANKYKQKTKYSQIQTNTKKYKQLIRFRTFASMIDNLQNF